MPRSVRSNVPCPPPDKTAPPAGGFLSDSIQSISNHYAIEELRSQQIQKIMNDFEKESSTMDMKEEMMSDAVDDAMEGEDEGEGEEMEGDKILKEVFDEIGMNMNDAVSQTASIDIRVRTIRLVPLRQHRFAYRAGRGCRDGSSPVTCLL